jgi:flagellar motor protein MotB
MLDRAVPPRRFRVGLDELHLVRRRDVIHVRDRDRADRIAEQIIGENDDSGADTQRRALANALAAGELLLVRVDEAPRSLDRPTVRPLVGPPGSRPSEVVSTWVQLEVVHETGGTFEGARFVIELPNGDLVDGVLDEASTWRLEPIQGGGPCKVRFYEPLVLSEEQQRRPSTAPARIDGRDIAARVGTAPDLRISTGRTHKVAVRPPPPVQMLRIEAGVFAAGSAFPTPALMRVLDHLAARLPDAPKLQVTPIGHADGAGDDASDKALSDRRARCIRAVLLEDLEELDAIADEEGWSLREDQAMLRGIGCNPAAIDGEAGPITERAVLWFLDEWSRGVHHPDGLDAPLEVSGELDDATRVALRRSYLLSLSPQLSEEQLAGPRGIGCASFNLEGDAKRPARGGLALWETESPRERRFPCSEGDPSACLLDDRGPERCRFYRETFSPVDVDEPPLLFDFDWLRLPSGKINLSAVTTLPDDTRVRVHMFANVRDYDGRVASHHGPAPLPERGDRVGPPLEGIVRYGVCVALWTPPSDWDPFDWRLWITDVDDPDTERRDGPEFHPPLFAIEYDGGWAFSQPPGERIDRFALRAAERGGIALANDGTLVAFGTRSDRVHPARSRRTDEHLRIVGWCAYRDSFAEEERP